MIRSTPRAGEDAVCMDELLLGALEAAAADRGVFALVVLAHDDEVDVAGLAVGQRRADARHQPDRAEVGVLLEARGGSGSAGPRARRGRAPPESRPRRGRSRRGCGSARARPRASCARARRSTRSSSRISSQSKREAELARPPPRARGCPRARPPCRCRRRRSPRSCGWSSRTPASYVLEQVGLSPCGNCIVPQTGDQQGHGPVCRISDGNAPRLGSNGIKHSRRPRTRTGRAVWSSAGARTRSVKSGKLRRPPLRSASRNLGGYTRQALQPVISRGQRWCRGNSA